MNISSGGNPLGADNVTVGPTTSVNIADVNALGTTAGNALTVNGGLTDTITEANLGLNGGGIVVNGGTGTTTVSITQTETALSLDGTVHITDGGFATNAAGTIATVTLNGLTGAGNAISDNALATLSVWNSDTELTTAPGGVTGPTGAQLTINDNSATTLALTLNNDGIAAAGANHALVITDSYATVGLTVSSNSFFDNVDNSLTALTTGT